jgi:hypothetical protein
MHLRAIYWFLSLLNIYFILLAELIETGPMRALICSPGLIDQDKIKITMKMSYLMKFRIIDHELCVCEYGLRQRTRRPKTGPWSEFNAAILLNIWSANIPPSSPSFSFDTMDPSLIWGGTFL